METGVGTVSAPFPVRGFVIAPITSMIQALFHAWERHLASISDGDRVVRPFEWGLDWVPQNGSRPGASPPEVLRHWVSHVMSDTTAFFTPEPTSDYRFSAPTHNGERLTSSAIETPHEQHVWPMVRTEAAHPCRRGAASVGSDEGGHVG